MRALLVEAESLWVGRRERDSTMRASYSITTLPDIFSSHHRVRPWGAKMEAVPFFHVTVDDGSSASTFQVTAEEPSAFGLQLPAKERVMKKCRRQTMVASLWKDNLVM